MRLEFNELPEEVQQSYNDRELTVHKITQRGTSTLIIQTKTYKTEIWRKQRRSWVRTVSKSKNDSFGTKLNIPLPKK